MLQPYNLRQGNGASWDFSFYIFSVQPRCLVFHTHHCFLIRPITKPCHKRPLYFPSAILSTLRSLLPLCPGKVKDFRQLFPRRGARKEWQKRRRKTEQEAGTSRAFPVLLSPLALLFQPLAAFNRVPLIQLFGQRVSWTRTKNVTKFPWTSWHGCQQGFCGPFASRRSLFFLCAFDHCRPFDMITFPCRILEYSSGILRFEESCLKNSLMSPWLSKLSRQPAKNVDKGFLSECNYLWI